MGGERVSVKSMAQTEDIGQHQQESGTRTTSSLGDGIERAMRDADKRLTRLLDKLHRAAQGSAAFEGAERDAKRVLDWLQAKTHELEGELQRVAHGAGAAAKNLTARKEHRDPEDERALDAPGDPEREAAGEDVAEPRIMERYPPDTTGG
jgi:hypothetical protein